MSPKKLHMLGRFLGKVGLGILATHDPAQARDKRFDRIRRYARFGDLKELWPLFHYTQGSLADLKRHRVEPESGDLLKDMDVYSYGLVEVAGTYTLFRFSMGVDHWVVCLDHPYPHPMIGKAFPNVQLDLMWYSEEQWKR